MNLVILTPEDISRLAMSEDQMQGLENLPVIKPLALLVNSYSTGARDLVYSPLSRGRNNTIPQRIPVVLRIDKTTEITRQIAKLQAPLQTNSNLAVHATITSIAKTLGGLATMLTSLPPSEVWNTHPEVILRTNAELERNLLHSQNGWRNRTLAITAKLLELI